MTNATTITAPVNFGRADHGQRRLGAGEPVTVPAPAVGRVPRIARLMALALRFDGLLRTGVLKDYAELARLGHVTRARISQVMTLLNLAPDIQEALLFLPRTERGRAPIILRDVLPIATTIDWGKQRRLWQRLVANGRLCRTW
jgi:hypothetical protein